MGTIFVAATHTAKGDARTGVQTVVRGLLRGLGKRSVDFQVVRWSKWGNALLPLDPKRSERLGIAHRREPSLYNRSNGSWLLLPEVIYQSNRHQVIRYARKQEMRLAAIFYDAIPVFHPELVRRQAAKYHAKYMKALCDVDLLIAISHSAAEQFRLFVRKHRLRLPSIHVCSLAGEIFGKERVAANRPALPNSVNILCVSTLDPRKNHSTLFEAFDLASAAVSQPELRLHLVGDRYKDADFIVQTVKDAIARNRNVIWHGKVAEQQLANFYRECDFTIFPSLVEGFGLPIAQSLWHRRPCICADFGAMAETAKGGGCLMADVRNPAKLADAIVALATRPHQRQKLVDEIESRHVKTWSEYTSEICELLEAADPESA
jgi:glycosyltransferase involved in cell wall biosynthesis